MKRTKVVDLGRVRNILGEWEKVRAAIAAGQVSGFHAALRNDGGQETIFMGGVYRNDPEAAMRTVLKVSAARALSEDEAPLFQASVM